MLVYLTVIGWTSFMSSVPLVTEICCSTIPLVLLVSGKGHPCRWHRRYENSGKQSFKPLGYVFDALQHLSYGDLSIWLKWLYQLYFTSTSKIVNTTRWSNALDRFFISGLSFGVFLGCHLGGINCWSGTIIQYRPEMGDAPPYGHVQGEKAGRPWYFQILHEIANWIEFASFCCRLLLCVCSLNAKPSGSWTCCWKITHFDSNIYGPWLQRNYQGGQQRLFLRDPKS